MVEGRAEPDPPEVGVLEPPQAPATSNVARSAGASAHRLIMTPPLRGLAPSPRRRARAIGGCAAGPRTAEPTAPARRGPPWTIRPGSGGPPRARPPDRGPPRSGSTRRDR